MPADTTPGPAGGTAVDPWAEQARRRAARRRRRIIRGAMVVAGVVLAGWIAVAIWALAGRAPDLEGDPGAPAATDVDDGASAAAGTSEGDDAAPDGTDPRSERTDAVDSGPSSSPTGDDDGADLPTAESFVEVDEAWLLGHDDGTVDWGVIVESISDVDRGPIRVDAVFRDRSGAEVAAADGVLSGVSAGGRAVVAGTLPSVLPMPARLQVDVAVGRPLDSPAFDGEGLEVRSLDRRVRPDGSEEATGLVVSTREEAASSLRLVLLWRDAAGSVVGSVVRDVARVRPGVPAHFTVPLGEDRVPDGAPTELLWSQLDDDG